MVRKVAARHRSFNCHSNCKRLYLSRKEGGRGLLNIHDVHNRTVTCLVAYIFNANPEHAKLIKKFWIHKKEGTQLKKVEDIIEDLGIRVSFTEDGVLHDDRVLPHKKLGTILKQEHQRTYRLWINADLHGKVLKTCAGMGMLLENSCKWLERVGLCG